MIFMSGNYRRTKSDIGRIIALDCLPLAPSWLR
jgi:hypothetical protein